MDSHSRSSPYNQSGPKFGPLPLHHRHMSPKPPMLDSRNKRTSPTASTKDSSTTLSRPIISNARVRRDEKYRKDMYMAFVNNALRQKAEGNGEPFDELLSQFNPKKIVGGVGSSPAQLRLWISALSHVVSQLDRPHAALVDAIVSLPWATLDSAFVITYVSFIGMLVSARPEYLSRVLERTVEGLTYQSGLQALNSSFPESSSSPLTRRAVYDRLHSLLQHLLSLIPTLPSTLQPILVRNFPHKRQNLVTQITYIRNLLRVSEYCPGLADRILGLIIDRTIQIDVEIQVELEELETEGEVDPGEVFNFDLFDNVIGQEGDESDSGSDGQGDDLEDISDMSSDAGDDSDREKPPAEFTVDTKRMQDMVTKLDSILKVVFDHFNCTHSAIVSKFVSSSSDLHPPPYASITPRSLSPVSIGNGKALRRSRFLTLLSIFDGTIIRTFKSRYTQFLIFWYSSLDPEFTDLFQGFLVSKALLEEDQPAVTRAAAASYIASFVSRAQFVDRASTRRVVGLLCEFLANHLDVYDANARRPDGGALQSMVQQTVFYAVVQALFLIFCFRWRGLTEDNYDEGDLDEFGIAAARGLSGRKKWMPELNVVQRVVSSPLNPLKICSANVVQQFARVAQSVGFVYCFSIIEANKRSEYSSTLNDPSTPEKSLSSVNSRTIPRSSAQGPTSHSPFTKLHVDADLTTFFPFDPYKLPKSGSYIQRVYREWSSVAIDDEDEEEDDEGEEDRGGSPEQWNEKVHQFSHVEDVAGGLGESFGGMSISPIRPSQLTLSI